MLGNRLGLGKRVQRTSIFTPSCLDELGLHRVKRFIKVQFDIELYFWLERTQSYFLANIFAAWFNIIIAKNAVSNWWKFVNVRCCITEILSPSRMLLVCLWLKVIGLYYRSHLFRAKFMKSKTGVTKSGRFSWNIYLRLNFKVSYLGIRWSYVNFVPYVSKVLTLSKELENLNYWHFRIWWIKDNCRGKLKKSSKRYKRNS